MFNPDFKEFIESLNDSHVRYLVIGGYALALHGHPRYTKDLDIWVERDPKNAQALVKAWEQFGMGSLGLTAADFMEPEEKLKSLWPYAGSGGFRKFGIIKCPMVMPAK